MKKRKFTTGITFFTTPQMYKKLKEISDEKDVSISEFLRDIIGEYFVSCSDCDSELCQQDSMISAETKGNGIWKN